MRAATAARINEPELMSEDSATTAPATPVSDSPVSGGPQRRALPAIARVDKMLWGFFSDVRVGVGLLVLIAVLTMVGTFLPQVSGGADELSHYVETIGRDRAALYNKLDLFDLYNSWYFNGILGLMCLALVIVSLDRFPKHWKLFRQWQPAPSDQKFRTASLRDRLNLKGAAAKLGDIQLAVKSVFGKAAVTEKNGATYLYVNRGRINRLGMYFVHVGILTIAFGTYYGSRTGFAYGQMRILEGFNTSKFLLVDRLDENLEPVVYRMELPFAVRNDKFTVEFYRDLKTKQISERAKEFRSKVTFIEDGKETLKTDLLVNEPVTYRGITFYQASYEKAGGVAHLMAGKPTDKIPTGYEAELDRPFRLAGSDDSYVVVEYVPEFTTEKEGNLGPAVYIERRNPDGTVADTFPVLQNYPGADSLRKGTHIFMLDKFVPRYVTGLQLTCDPGINITWAGCVLMIAGLLIAFYIPHRQIWVRVDGGGIALAAYTNRLEDSVSKKFQALVARIAESTGAQPVPGAAGSAGGGSGPNG